VSVSSRLAVVTQGLRGGSGTTKIVEAFAISIDLSTAGGTPGVAKDTCLREIKDWCFTSGDNPTLVVTMTDTSDGSAIDITGATIVLTVSKDDEPTDTSNQLFQLTGAIQAPSTGGIVHFQPTKTQANQPADTYFYDVQVTFSDGTRRTIATGDWVYDGKNISDPGAN